MKRIFKPANRKRILIVDDDHALGNIYRDQLRHGFEVEIVSNNREARQKIENGSIDLVVLDLSVPGTDRVEMLRKIRWDQNMRTLPAVVFLNPFLGGVARAARDAGATKCVTKAECTGQNLVEVMHEIFEAGAGRFSWSAAAKGNTIAQQRKLDATCLREVSEALANLRISHYAFVKAEDEDLRRVELCEMRQQVHFLAGVAGLNGSGQAAQLASALEALFIDLHAKPKNIKQSVMRTIAQAVEGLSSSLADMSTPVRASAPLKVLVMNDEIIARKTICSAMAQAGLTVVNPDNPMEAQRLLERDRFDLIFLDTETPGMGGIELWSRIRKMPANCTTPMVVVTAHSDFEIRAQSILSGTTDFIAKPFVSVELAVKALTLLLRENRPSLAKASAQNDSPVEEDYETALFAGFPEVEIVNAFA